MSCGWWRRSRALRALTPTLASALFLLASAPLLAQTATTTLWIEVERSTVIEGETIRWRLRADPPPRRSITADVKIASGIRGTLDSGEISTNASISKNKAIGKGPGDRGTEGGWYDRPTLVREEDNDDTVTFTTGPNVYGDPTNPYAFGDPTRVKVLDPTNAGDPNVNGDSSVDANDALILYYAYSLRNDLGTGR